MREFVIFVVGTIIGAIFAKAAFHLDWEQTVTVTIATLAIGGVGYALIWA